MGTVLEDNAAEFVESYAKSISHKKFIPLESIKCTIKPQVETYAASIANAK